jgi:hypothetical protein
MEKAKRIKDQGRVHILNNQTDHVVGRVEGDHGTYTTQIWRQDPDSQAITMWDCECPWDQYAWQRTRQWKKYEGRPCSHVLALYWTAQQNAAQQPQVPEGQMQLPGMTPAAYRTTSCSLPAGCSEPRRAGSTTSWNRASASGRPIRTDTDTLRYACSATGSPRSASYATRSAWHADRPSLP